MKLKIFIALLLMAAGVFLFVFGGYDDSPGAQGLGLIVAIYGGVRLRRATRHQYYERT